MRLLSQPKESNAAAWYLPCLDIDAAPCVRTAACFQPCLYIEPAPCVVSYQGVGLLPKTMFGRLAELSGISRALCDRLEQADSPLVAASFQTATGAKAKLKDGW